MTWVHPGVSARTALRSISPGARPRGMVAAMVGSARLVYRCVSDDGTLPVRRHLCPRLMEVSGANGADQCAVLSHRGGAGLELIEMRQLDALQPLSEQDHELRENGICRPIDYDAMEGCIASQGFRGTVSGNRFNHGGVGGAQRLQVLPAEPLKGNPQSRHMQRLGNRVDLEQMPRHDRADTRPLIALALDEALILQLAQRLAHRRAAHAELLRELRIAQYLEGLQSQIEDQFFQLTVDDFPRGLALESAEGSGQGHR